VPEPKHRRIDSALPFELDESPATTVENMGRAGHGAAQLLVLEASGLTAYPLPSSGLLSIGRADECEIRLRDPLASRRHATLHVVPLAIEDNGSANGTRLAERPLAAGEIAPLQVGQAVSIGNCVLLVRRTDACDAPKAAKSAARILAVSPRIVFQPAMEQLFALVERLARGSINVLILGETGVGKEIVAEAIHCASPRNGAPLVRINCAALADSLLESELFGHERGAFTGAVMAKAGLIEAADGGTVFLDEVGELPAPLQAKLLRVIEAREVTRVGSVRARRVDVRFVSATNRNLDRAVANGTFRADLLYRLNGTSIEVPPLRERPLEILPMANLFIARVSAQLLASQAPTLSEPAIQLLLAHGWPGNVRELRNVVERAVLLCSGTSIEAEHLALREAPAAPSASEPRASSSFPPPAQGATRETLAPPVPPAERDRIAGALQMCAGNQSRAAAFLGISRRTLVRKIAQLGLPRPRACND
jgi:two-component system, NtrC family, response regulator AtoC